MAPLGAEVIPEVTRSSPPSGRVGRSQSDRKVDSEMREAAHAVVCCFSAVSLTEVRVPMSILRYCSFRYWSLERQLLPDLANVTSSGHQSRERGSILTVLGEGDLAGAVDGNESVLIRLLRVLVDETARQHGHLVSVENRDVGESSGLDVVATVLGEEHRDVRVGEVGSERAVPGLGERGVAAPFLLLG